MHEMCVRVCVRNYFKAGHCCLGLLLFASEADLKLCLAVHACIPWALASTWASSDESEIPLQDLSGETLVVYGIISTLRWKWGFMEISLP